MCSYWLAHLEHLLIAVCDRMAGHNVGFALLEGLPADSGLSLSLLRRPGLIFWKKETVSGSVAQLNDLGHPRAVRPRDGHVDKSLARSGDGGVRLVPAVRQSGVVVVVLCVLHALAPAWSRLHRRTQLVHHNISLGNIHWTKGVVVWTCGQRKR